MSLKPKSRVKTCALLFSCLLPSSLLLAADGDDIVPIQLDAVVVSATGYEQMVEDAPASITVVPRAELEKGTYRDVTDALMDVPGVVITGGGTSSDISIRGMAPKYTMILVDGKRQNTRETRPNADGPGIEQSWLPPLDAIERIEVVRGPMSALYGSDAMGGVINIITRKVPLTWGGSIRSALTLQEDSASGNGHQTQIYAGGPLIEDKLGIQFHGQKQHRAEDRIIDGFGKHDVTSGTAKITFTPVTDHDLVAEFSRSIQKRVATPGKSDTLTAANGQPNTINATTYDKNTYALSHNGRWSDHISSNTYAQVEKADNPERDMYLKNREFNTQWDIVFGDHILALGGHYIREELQDLGNELYAQNRVTDLERYQWALFAEDEWLMTDDFSLTSGVRMTKDENYGTHWTPRLYGIWHTTDNFSIKGGVSTGFRAPSLREAVADWGQVTGGRGSAIPAVILGNPELKPEKSVSKELGIYWDNHENLTASLTVFDTDFKNKLNEEQICNIDHDPICVVYPGGKSYRFISKRFNVDKATIRGVEATSTWDMRDDLRLAANYTYTHSKQKSGPFKGKPLNKMPRHMLNVALDWDITPDLDYWSKLNFRGKTTDYQSRSQMAAGTPSFAFVDTGIVYRFNEQINVGVAVYNLLDKRVTPSEYDAVYDGRRYWAQMHVSF